MERKERSLTHIRTHTRPTIHTTHDSKRIRFALLHKQIFFVLVVVRFVVVVLIANEHLPNRTF